MSRSKETTHRVYFKSYNNYNVGPEKSRNN